MKISKLNTKSFKAIEKLGHMSGSIRIDVPGLKFEVDDTYSNLRFMTVNIDLDDIKASKLIDKKSKKLVKFAKKLMKLGDITVENDSGKFETLVYSDRRIEIRIHAKKRMFV